MICMSAQNPRNVVANDRKQAVDMAWEHGGADFQSRFDKSTGQAREMKEGALRVL